MPRRIKLEPHLTESELYGRYNSSKYSRTERDRYHALWLLSSGKKSEEVASVTRFAVQGVRNLVKRYNREGPDAMVDRRRHNGADLLLGEEDCKALEDALSKEPPGGGLWDGVKVAAWIAQRIQRDIQPQLGWDYLKRLEYALRVPRRRHRKGDEKAQHDFKKKG